MQRQKRGQIEAVDHYGFKIPILFFMFFKLFLFFTISNYRKRKQKIF